MLARARRSVVVIDAGAPRNAPAEGVHGLLGREGMPPGEVGQVATRPDPPPARPQPQPQPDRRDPLRTPSRGTARGGRGPAEAAEARRSA